MNQTFVKASDGHLPWNASPVREYARVGQYIGDSLSAELRQFLPFNISCFADHAVADHDVRSFLDAVPTELEQELRRRIRRADALARVSGSPSADVLHFLTGRRDRQPWVLLYSRQGGLPLSHEEKLGSGVVPCSSMQNHGVAWRVDGHGSTQTWLATSPGENAPWNFDSDIGHESAHAAFAHVPLFAQGVQVAADAARFANLPDAAVMTPGHFAKLCYFFVEVAVVALRGEQRDTESGLPVVTAEELIALLRLSRASMMLPMTLMFFCC